MEGGTRYGGVVVKSKSASGLKKKGEGMGMSPSVKQGTEKKRQRVVSGDSESSEEPHVRKEVVQESGFSSRRNGFDHVEDDRFGKKSKLDVFEFDEYDRFNEDLRVKKDSGDDGEDSEEGRRKFLSPSDAQQKQPEAGTGGGGGDIVYKRRNSFKGGSGRLSSSMSKVDNQCTSRCADSLFSSKKSNASLESIRVQGKNGVLKVRMNTTNGSGLLKMHSLHAAEDYKTSKDGIVLMGEQLAISSRALEARFDDQAGSVGRTGKALLNLHNSMSTRTSQMQDSGSDDSDNSSKSGRDFHSRKEMSRKQSKGKITAPLKSTSAISRSRDDKSKRGSGTEKQKLREHIKQMLLDAGWTIDYRPRRNRDYNDAVYVNTLGTSYWSIIKAYDALRKEASDKNESLTNVGESSFSPLPETMLCKLTRKTRQKMDREKKIKHQGKGRSGRLKQTPRRRSLKPKSESEETTSDEDEDEEEDFDDEDLRMVENDLNRNPGSQHLDQVSHDEDPMCGDSKSSHLQLNGRKSKKLGRYTLLVRDANRGMNPSDGYIPYTGKRTLLSWLIDCGTVELSEKVRYMNRSRKRILQQGWITRDGIHCVCCSKIVTIEKFEIHARSKFRQPFQNIITESGASLLQCLLEAWNKQAESAHDYFHNVDVVGDDPNDDTCSICGDGGDLICCDGCPSTFHQTCLGIEVLPTGDWHCPQCICVHCGVIDASEVGSDTAKHALQTCNLCEKKYHFSCSDEVNSCADNSSGFSFCGIGCEELHKTLEKLVGVRNEMEAGYSWSLIRRTIVDSNDSINTTPQNIECNAKLAVAQTIMDECFLPIVDRRSQANLIHNVLYSCGSNLKRLDYRGFYTAILEKGDDVISAASLRFHGTQFAEMPFIGTRHIYRRQGMCRRLFSAIESALRYFKVEKLVIPAISELLHTWTEVFGFHHVQQSDKKKLRHVNMLVFPGIDMLQKVLIEKEQSEGEAFIRTGAYNGEEVASDSMCQDTGVLLNDSSIPSSPLDDENACSEPVNGSAGHMNESWYPDEQYKVCVDGLVTNEKAGAPDSSVPPNSPGRKDLLHSKDENTSYKIKSEEMKPEFEYEMGCPTDSSVPVAKMKDRPMSQWLNGKDFRFVEDADNNNMLEGCDPDNAEPVDSLEPVSDGCVKSAPSDDCAVLVACTDKKIDFKPCLETFQLPHLEANQSSTIELTSDTAACQERTVMEYSGDATECEPQSRTPLDTSNGDIDMEDAEVQRTTCENFNPHLSSDTTAAENFLHRTRKEKHYGKVALPIFTPDATLACIAVEPDEDVDMISSKDPSITPCSSLNEDQHIASNGVAHDKGSEPLVALKIVSDAVCQTAIYSASESLVIDHSEAKP